MAQTQAEAKCLGSKTSTPAGTTPLKTDLPAMWESCCVLWTSVTENPLPSPYNNTHTILLCHFRALGPVVFAELPPSKQLDARVVEDVRNFLVRYLSRVARTLDLISARLGAGDTKGASDIRNFLATDEAREWATWVDNLVNKERDEQKVWGVYGYCLLEAVQCLSEIPRMLETARQVQSADSGGD